MDLDTLLEFIKGDELGILDVKPQSKPQGSQDRLITSFLEINDFRRERGCEPQADGKDMKEFELCSRLNGFRANPDKVKPLIQYDEYELLNIKNQIFSIKDIFNNDNLGILDDCSGGIFDIKHIAKEVDESDYVAQRKPCLDFDDYEYLFKQCHRDLASSKRKMIIFAKEQQIEKGDFFVLKGVLTYIAHVGKKKDYNGKRNARLRCIFENGTESDVLLRSLARELYRDGSRITAHEDQVFNDLKGIAEEDRETGYIYVLKSKSQRSDIQSIRHLYKIGFSRTSVEERIRNAEQDPTYLMAPVVLVASYQCYNLNPQKLELLLHAFFGSVCLNIDVFDREGKRCVPREWFIVHLRMIDQAVDLLLKGDIAKYRYDSDQKQIIRQG